MTHRSASALRPPHGSLAGFPRLSVTGTWFREHEFRNSPDFGCWWFSSVHGGDEPNGRFDLAPPLGSCYVGETQEVAARERVGLHLAHDIPIPGPFVEGRVVTEVPIVAGQFDVADTTHTAAGRFRLTREISTISDYALTADWARAFEKQGFSGVAYEPRFSTGRELACALFSAAGAQPSRAVGSFADLRHVLRAMGVDVVAPPFARTIRFDDTAEPI